MTTTIEEEQELQATLKAWGHQHDCEEAGCEMNPQGEKIPPGRPQKRRRTGLKRAQEIWRKHRKGELI